MNSFNKLSLTKIRNILLKKGYIIDKKPSRSFNKNIKNFFSIFFLAFLLIGFFGISPTLNKLTNQLFYTAEVIENKSKMDFEKVLSGKELDLSPEEKKKITFKDLFFDVFDFDEIPEDTVRLSAATLEQLFKDTKYNLKDIRKNKLVKPISVNLLPNEIKFIENTKKRKELFIKIVLPLILEENSIIKLDRKRLFVILNKNNNSKSERNWLNKKFKQYGVVNRDLTTLKIRMDEIPVSLAIAQAAKETGWGTSRFALEGNALFGQWTYDGEGIKPAGSSDGDTHKVMKFKILKASVRAYQRNLNTHSSYRDFREARAIQRDHNGKLNSLELVKYLDKYAETGREYTEILTKIIEQNVLIDFDDAKLLPTSEKLKKII
tara:strand:- start:6278 stop:7408 length:1131 start_codon:yes stop_codon:yes gene_type:complete